MSKSRLIAILTYTFSSISSAVADVVLYAVIVRLFITGIDEKGIIIATVIARIGSSFVNYAINHKLTFKGRSDILQSMIKYFFLAAIQIGLSAVAVIWLYKYLHFNDIISKMVVDTVILYASFPLQKAWVFKESPKKTDRA